MLVKHKAEEIDIMKLVWIPVHYHSAQKKLEQEFLCRFVFERNTKHSNANIINEFYHARNVKFNSTHYDVNKFLQFQLLPQTEKQ